MREGLLKYVTKNPFDYGRFEMIGIARKRGKNDTFLVLSISK